MKRKSVLAVFLTAFVLVGMTGCPKSEGNISSDAELGTGSDTGNMVSGEYGSGGSQITVDTNYEPEIAYSDNSFLDISLLSEGKLAAQDAASGLWGYIDKLGNWVIEPQYYNAMPFYEGKAAVKNANGMYIFIDETGAQAFDGEYSRIEGVWDNTVPPKAYSRYKYQYGFSDGKAIVTESINGIEYNRLIEGTMGMTVHDETDEDIRYYNQGKHYAESWVRVDDIYDYDLNEVFGWEDFKNLNPEWSTMYLDEGNNFTDGKYYCYGENWVSDLVDRFIIDSNGELVLRGRDLENFSTAIASADDSNWKLYDNYVVAYKTMNGVTSSAVYDYSGKLILDFKYTDIHVVDDSTFLAENNAGVAVLLSVDGTELVPAQAGREHGGRGYLSDAVLTINGRTYVRFVNNGTIEYYDLNTKEFAKDAARLTAINSVEYNYGNILFEKISDTLYINVWDPELDSRFSVETISLGKAPCSAELLRENVIISYDKETRLYSIGHITNLP